MPTFVANTFQEQRKMHATSNIHNVIRVTVGPIREYLPGPPNVTQRPFYSRTFILELEGGGTVEFTPMSEREDQLHIDGATSINARAIDARAV